MSRGIIRQAGRFIAVRLLLLAAAGCAAAGEKWVNPPAERVPGVEHKTFRSASMKLEVGYSIFLPPEYASSRKRYPVVYFLPGRGDGECTHLGNLAIQDNAMRGAGNPAILVHAFGGRNNYYADSSDGTLMGESCIVKELIPHIDATYRTIASRGGRAVHGFSMGGFGALKFACKHPDLFAAAVSVSGAFIDGAALEQKNLSVLIEIFGDSVKRFDEESPAFLARQNAAQVRGRTALRLVVGTDDALLPANRKMHALLEQLKIPHEYEETAGVKHDCAEIYGKAGPACFAFIAKALAKGE